ncbi:hypothetical protein JQC72_13110 [Polycladomyces sp. WAk]|uniref:Uncharacterized protein n=1 Tax=Polycladomyces zharkentensis TaxID=2807616 RepID=A0ABS2WM09_9BACL|nr:hypothetical protein [Polycladomyces sp. WAk]MBN2910439.1 hypothetical protein [Polycladomyces sp. WAk]
MNKFIRFGLIFITSVVLVLSGCVQQNQASAPELEKPKEQELTVAEVLQKSANVMSKGGYAYDMRVGPVDGVHHAG